MDTPRRFSSHVRVTVSEDNESQKEMCDETDATMRSTISHMGATPWTVFNDALLTVSIERQEEFFEDIQNNVSVLYQFCHVTCVHQSGWHSAASVDNYTTAGICPSTPGYHATDSNQSTA